MPRPKITNVIAASINGLIANHKHESDSQRSLFQLTNSSDQKHVAKMMATSDAIITGANSLRSESKLRTELGLGGKCPTWIIFTTKGISKDHAFWTQNQIKRVLVSPSKIENHNKDVIHLVAKNKSSVDTVLDYLTDNAYEHALLFGGGQVNQMFYEKQMVDELVLTTSPVLFQSEDSVNILPKSIKPISFELLSVNSDESGNVYSAYQVTNKN